MNALPEPSARFTEKKSKVLQQLAVPDSEYTDASPKGSVDEGIRALIDEINSVLGFVTTSSCAGRVSVFLEGRKASNDGNDGSQIAGIGGKGAGGTWLFVSHEPVEETEAAFRRLIEELNLETVEDPLADVDDVATQRLIRFKFEPMILHVLTTSLLHAQILISCALQAGLRESGALNLVAPNSSVAEYYAMPMVGIRSIGPSMESLIGFETTDGQRRSLVSPSYIRCLVRIANNRFAENARRIQRFQSAFEAALQGPPSRLNAEGEAWEDPDIRRARKRAEGLRRKAELDSQGEEARTGLD